VISIRSDRCRAVLGQGNELGRRTQSLARPQFLFAPFTLELSSFEPGPRWIGVSRSRRQSEGPRDLQYQQGERVVITESPVLKAASSRRSAEGRLRTRHFWWTRRILERLQASRTSKYRRCAASFANLSPFSKAVPSRDPGSPNQWRAASRNHPQTNVPTACLLLDGPQPKTSSAETIMAVAIRGSQWFDERGLSDPSSQTIVTTLTSLLPGTIQKARPPL